MRRLLILLLLVVSSFVATNAQSFDEEEKEKKDSTLYQNIYEQSKQNRFNKFIYDLIFKSPSGQPKDSLDNSSKDSKLPYNHKEFEKKIIRKIIITNEAPFGVDEESESTTKKKLSKTGNLLHTNTQSFVIKNLLLFKEREKFDSLLIQESERLLRSQPYVEKSAIYGMDVDGNSDSIDVVVVVKDKFSIYPEADMSSSKLGFGLKEINLFGLGHQAHIYYSWNSGGIYSYQYDYKIPNILNTYINTNILYNHNRVDQTETKQFNAERPFYSPIAKWAGGVTVMQQSQKYDINIPYTNDFINQRFKYNVIDFWGAYAFNFKGKNTANARIRKLVLSARYYHIDYIESPELEYDPLNIYSVENFYLASVGISKRAYQKDSYLFRYGFTEDVPVGYNFSLIGGLQYKNNQNRLYLAAKLSMGKYYKPGYFSGAIEYGSFFEGIEVKEGVFAIEMCYFTPLFEVKKWKFRNLIKSQYLTGINRLETDRLSLQDYFGISGLNSRTITGTQKFVCSFQTQVFTPWSLWGFKFAPYFIYSIGMLGDHENGFRKSKPYSLFGLGFLIRNDFLVFNSFEISISFYPFVPEHGYNVFKFNAYEASDFKFRDYDIKKPEQVIYK